MKVENLLKKKIDLLKELENCKLEIDSGRKKEKSTQFNQVFFKENGQISEEKKKNIKETSEKEKTTKNLIKNELKILYDQEKIIQNDYKNIKNEVKNMIKPKIKINLSEISSKKSEIQKLKENLSILDHTSKEIHEKIIKLRKNKNDEIHLSMKKIAKVNGGLKDDEIDQLYEAKANKESETFELELKIIRNQRDFAREELEKNKKILELEAKLEVLDSKFKNFDKNTEKLQFSYPIHLDTCENIDDSVCVIKESLEITQKFESKSHDFDENSKEKKKIEKKNKHNERPETWSDFSIEIPYPKEKTFKLSENSSSEEQKLLFSILPLLKGDVFYKKYPSKSKKSFDPLEFRLSPPEDCGYLIKKVKLNKQLTKLEIRNIGKPGIESSILIDQIKSITSPELTFAITKSQKNKVKSDASLDELAEYSKSYQEMKSKGSLDYNTQAFIFLSQETHYFQFFINVNSSKIELISDNKKKYSTWVFAIRNLINNKTLFEKLKFKIIET